MTIVLVGVVIPLMEARAASLAPESQLSFQGTSNVHSYSVRATTLQSNILFASGKKAIKTFELIIPVDQLTSGKANLDKKMYRALKGDQSPQIVFKLQKYGPCSQNATPPSTHVCAEGELSLAGITRPITLEANLEWSQDRLVIEGSKEILMTDFGIDPPTAMLGMLTTHPQVDVQFLLIIHLLPERSSP